MQEIEEMIRVAEIARIEAKPGVERIGLSIDQIEQLSDDLKSTILISRATFVLGIFLVIYAIQKELFKIKNKLS